MDGLELESAIKNWLMNKSILKVKFVYRLSSTKIKLLGFAWTNENRIKW